MRNEQIGIANFLATPMVLVGSSMFDPTPPPPNDNLAKYVILEHLATFGAIRILEKKTFISFADLGGES